MPLSMTGFGRGEYADPQHRTKVEIRSVNHRYLDLSVHISRAYQAIEDRVRARLTERLSRGKVDIFVGIERSSEIARKVQLDAGLADGYVEALNGLKERYAIPDPITLDILVRLPDVVRPMDSDEDVETLWRSVQPALDAAIVGLVDMRRREGQALADDIAARLDRVAAVTEEMSQRAPVVVEAYRVRLIKRIAELASDIAVEPARLATEVAIFADRSNINEELTRLGSHVSQARGLLRSDEPVGRRYDFLVQEMNREANTIGSKANDLELARSVIEVKSELEKIREQIQNLE